MDEVLEEDPRQIELEQVIAVLTPLRQHRLARAERDLHRAKDDLKAMEEQLVKARALLDQMHEEQQERRRTLAQMHLQQTTKRTTIDQWRAEEQRMLDRIAKRRQDIDEQSLSIDAQKTLLEQFRQAATARQRAVEKLACLSEALNDGIEAK
ncbi:MULTISPECIES: type III secretion protein [Pseudomonas]|uniref:Type III secretion protein n=1 Tax=Pseudomonas wuhanensis TaxID=2954098 RepID=A0ABY9GLW1_9PSED|nr:MULTISPECIES: type III secretion protein [unclassified Pseudomonas]WLI10706.1 type III secretion protein [Pseudomonas sp. FP603]WLI16522.1 type III secretion protein [Pseudomonas sp. FP607]